MRGDGAASLADCPVGIVPILWNNVDLPDLRAPIDALTVLDEIAAAGFDGCQFGAGFPEGDRLTAELARRRLRLAEVYASITCAASGPSTGALNGVRDRLALLDSAGGEVLVVALDIAAERSAYVGRTHLDECPKLAESGWDELAELLGAIAGDVAGRGHRAAFHPHAGTYVENPEETQRLAGILRDTGIGLCLDIAHFAVGGGDAVTAIGEYRDVLTHVHLKDVDSTVVDQLRAGSVASLQDALRARLFTELGRGALDLDGVLAALAGIEYSGWLMLEQDTSWLPPSEAAAISKSYLDTWLAS